MRAVAKMINRSTHANGKNKTFKAITTVARNLISIIVTYAVIAEQLRVGFEEGSPEELGQISNTPPDTPVPELLVQQYQKYRQGEYTTLTVYGRDRGATGSK